MGAPAFSLRRPPLLRLEDLEHIEEAAQRILERVGIAVVGDEPLAALAARGFAPAADGRIRIERRLARAFLDEERARNGRAFSLEPQPPPPAAPFEVGVSNYSLAVHDIEADRVVPYTTARLIETTKLVDGLYERGVRATAPGTPADVPGPLQPVVQLWVSATYCRAGRTPTDIKSLASLPYVVEMTEALGRPLRDVAVYVFSPLTLSGESLACAMAMGPKLETVGVASMPLMGVSAPIHAGDAFAVSAAEVIGSAILVRELTGLRPRWAAWVFPADMRSLMMVFGSPENFFLQMMSNELHAYLHGTPWSMGAGNIHVMAKMPGVQASAERGSLMTVGALLGQRTFGSVGTLSLDEVFSAEQLLYDLEIVQHVERFVRGLDGACDPDRCVADVVGALERQTYAALESTRDAYAEVYWHPRLFERRSLTAWQAAGSPSIRRQVHDEIRRLVAAHSYTLDADTQKAIDAILARAKARLG